MASGGGDHAEKKKKKGSGSSEKKKYQKSYFDVLGLCCPSEVPLIENILNSLDGVKEFSVIVPTRTVIVVHDNLLLSQNQIVKALNQGGLEANARAYGETNHKKKWPTPYAVASGFLLALSFLKYVYPPFRWLALAAVAAGGIPILFKAFASIRNLRIDINILAIIAGIGTIYMKDYTEAATIVFLLTISEWLESRASYKANAAMSSLMNLAPQKAIIAESGEEVDTDEVKINTVLAVKAGEVIPIDGIVVDGNSEVDEKTLTGESFPVPKQKDSNVWAGTINLNGYISIKTTALAEDCVVAKMTKLVEEAQNSKSRTQRFIDRCSQYYTPGIIIISTSLAVIPAVLRVRDLKYWIHLALVVLVSACPCALILSTPVVTFCALTKAASSGLLIKGSDYLEVLSKIKVAAFDKTGTITRGEFVVVDFQSLVQDISLDTLLYWVSSIESKSSHPMAKALVDFGRSHLVTPNPDSVVDYQNFPGEGIHGKIDGKNIYIGNRKIGARAGCSSVSVTEGDRNGGKTIGYIYCGDSLVGIFSLSDACRSGVAAAIQDLKLLRIKSVMLTGDNQASAMHAQEQLGNALEVVHSELLPEDKARIIKELKKEIGSTAMIGDGVNDAPALATADIGISMGISGSALATQTGHIILMSNDIRKIPKAIRLARKARRKVIENVVLSISTKAGIIGLAFAGYPLVWAAVVADVGTCLLVILNSMLILQTQPNSQTPKSSSLTILNCCFTGGSQTHSHSHKACASKCQLNPCTAKSSHHHGHNHGTCNNHETHHEHHHGTSNNHKTHHEHHHGTCNNHETHHEHNRETCNNHETHHEHDHGTCNHETHHELNHGTCNNHGTHHEHNHGTCNNHGTHHEHNHGTCNNHETHHEHNHGTCNNHGTHLEHHHGTCNTHEHNRGTCNTHETHDHEHSHGCSNSHTSCKQDNASTHDDHNHHELLESSHHLEEGTSLNNNIGLCKYKCCDDHNINRVDDHDKLQSTAGVEQICCGKKHHNDHQYVNLKYDHDHVIMCDDDLGGGILGHGDHSHGCVSLERREYGGCCRSYLKEYCCTNHGHFGGGLGGLTEIVTE